MSTTKLQNKPNHYDVLVTGGTGFVGQEFVHNLGARFNGSVLVGQRTQEETVRRGPNVYYGFLDLERFSSPCSKVRIVVHIAGEKADKNKMMQVNVEGTRQLLHWAINNDVEKFVYLSSDGVYGVNNKAELVDTSHIKTPNNEYEYSKMIAEEMVREIASKHGVKWAIIQPTNIIGLNSRSRNPLIGLFRSIRNGQFRYIGRQSSYVNYVAVENVVEAMFCAMLSKEPTGTYIINTPAKLKDFIDESAKLLDVKPPQRFIPRLPAAGIAAMLSIFKACTGRNQPFDLLKFRELTNQTVFDGSEIEKSLNFKYPVSWREMLHNLVDTYRTTGLL